MRKHFKKYFIPHEENGHAPHFLRNEAITVVIGIIVAAEIAFLFSGVILRETNLFALIFPDALVSQTNDNRLANYISPLSISPVLQRAAELKAKDMAEKSYFAHTSPEGITPWHWFDEAGYKYAYAGENLAVNFSDSIDVTNAWMNSPTHKANMLNNRFTEIGIAMAKGIYKGQETTFVVQMFGRPVIAATTPIAATETETTPTPQEEPQATGETEVAGEEIVGESQTADQTETFIAVRGAEAAPIEEAPAPAPEKIEPLAIVKVAASSPRNTTNILFGIIAIILAVALAMKILIKIRIQHPRLILNGIVALMIVAAAITLNQHIALSLAQVL